MNGLPSVLQQVPFDEPFKDEAWLQDLVFRYPRLIPVDEIEPVFEGLIPLARELQTEAGPIDLVFVNSAGRICIIETKLWRNPESRRKVVAQIIDYAKELGEWTFENFFEEVKKSNPDFSLEKLYEGVRLTEPAFDISKFHDSVQRSLNRGEFLLLILGDGIQEGVEQLVDYLNQTPRLHFTLALLEMALFRTSEESSEPLLIQPRVLARTKELVRAVVEIKGSIQASEIIVTTPKESFATTSTTKQITAEAFFKKLSAAAKPETVAAVRWLLDALQSRRYRIWWGKDSALIQYPDPVGGLFAMGRIGASLGDVAVYFKDHCNNAGCPEIGQQYYDDLAKLFPPAKGGQYKLPKGNVTEVFMMPDASNPPIDLMASKAEQWLSAMDNTTTSIRKFYEAKEQ